jgi:CheY-like chemotaxis protein
MSAVLGMVGGHSGAIMVSSTVGKGTSIRVLFPAVKSETPLEAPKAQPPAQLAPPAIGSGTVLVVDDEDVVRNLASRSLARLGFRVLLANNGRQGVDLFREHVESIDCVLLDLTMPEMDGAETFSHMKNIRPTIPVVLSSGYDEQELNRKFNGMGLAGMIQKPYTVQGLQECLHRILKERPAR